MSSNSVGFYGSLQGEPNFYSIEQIFSSDTNSSVRQEILIIICNAIFTVARHGPYIEPDESGPHPKLYVCSRCFACL
jgi:hypothetical protein